MSLEKAFQKIQIKSITSFFFKSFIKNKKKIPIRTDFPFSHVHYFYFSTLSFQGVKFLRRFKQLLNPAQVFDLMNGGPNPG